MGAIVGMNTVRFESRLTLYTQEGRPVTAQIFSILLIDDSRGRKVVARLPPAPKSIVLWKGADYDAAGDYTQAQAEARIVEVLGENPELLLGYPKPKVSSSSSSSSIS